QAASIIAAPRAAKRIAPRMPLPAVPRAPVLSIRVLPRRFISFVQQLDLFGMADCDLRAVEAPDPAADTDTLPRQHGWLACNPRLDSILKKLNSGRRDCHREVDAPVGSEIEIEASANGRRFPHHALDK